MEANPATPRKKHVLIVEDDFDLAQLLKEQLEAENFDVSTAPNGALALKHILHKEVDAIVCDLKMPKLTGDVFYTTVARGKPALAKRFIFLTAFADEPQFQAFVRSVESPVLQKPVAFETLLAEIARITG
jgi:DNA-binding response OmpR family regulator